MAESMTVRTDDGRDLDVLIDGKRGGFPLLFHGGTPSAAVEFRLLADAAGTAGAQLITYSRPGYATSTPLEGRTVADATGDVESILEHLGLDRFVALGWSCGGPHALACAALLPERCSAATSLAGVAPYDADGLDWYAGMGEENVEEFAAAADSASALEGFLTAPRSKAATSSPDGAFRARTVAGRSRAECASAPL